MPLYPKQSQTMTKKMTFALAKDLKKLQMGVGALIYLTIFLYQIGLRQNFGEPWWCWRKFMLRQEVENKNSTNPSAEI